jgi:hypothetical protein
MYAPRAAEAVFGKTAVVAARSPNGAGPIIVLNDVWPLFPLITEMILAQLELQCVMFFQ